MSRYNNSVYTPSSSRYSYCPSALPSLKPFPRLPTIPDDFSVSRNVQHAFQVSEKQSLQSYYNTDEALLPDKKAETESPTFLEKEDKKLLIINEYLEDNINETTEQNQVRDNKKAHSTEQQEFTSFHFPDWDDVNNFLNLVFDGTKARPRSLELNYSFFNMPNWLATNEEHFNGFHGCYTPDKEYTHQASREKSNSKSQSKPVKKSYEEESVASVEINRTTLDLMQEESLSCESPSASKNPKEVSWFDDDESIISFNSHAYSKNLIESPGQKKCEKKQARSGIATGEAITLFPDKYETIAPLKLQATQPQNCYTDISNENPYATSLWHSMYKGCQIRDSQGIEEKKQAEASEKNREVQKTFSEAQTGGNVNKESASFTTNDYEFLLKTRADINSDKMNARIKPKDSSFKNSTMEAFAGKFTVPSIDTFSSHYSKVKSQDLGNYREINNGDKREEYGKLRKFEFSNLSQLIETESQNSDRLMSLFDKCAFELLETEITYRNDLKVVLDVYLSTLNYPRYKYLLNEGEKQVLFSNISDLIGMSNKFLELVICEFKDKTAKVSKEIYQNNDKVPILSLISPISQQSFNSDESCLKGNCQSPVSLSLLEELSDLDHGTIDSTIIKDVIHETSKSEKFSINFGSLLLEYFSNEEKYQLFSNYLTYSNKFKQQQDLLKEKLYTSGGPDFLRWYKESLAISKTTKTTSWDLESLLIKPIQRLTKYKLLVDQMMVHSSQENKDAMKLRQAGKLIEQIAKDVNSNNIQRARKVLKSVVKTHLKPEVSSKQKSTIGSSNFFLKQAHDDPYGSENCKSNNEPNIKTNSQSVNSQLLVPKLDRLDFCGSNGGRSARGSDTGSFGSALSGSATNKTTVTAKSISTEATFLSTASSKASMGSSSSKGTRNLGIYQIRQSQFAKIPAQRIAYVNLTLEFKAKYEIIKRLNVNITGFINLLSALMTKNKVMHKAYSRVISCGGDEYDSDEELLKCNDQVKRYEACEKQMNLIKKVIIILNNEVLMKLLLCTVHCDQIRNLINEERENRIHFHEYMMLNEKRNKHNDKKPKASLQKSKRKINRANDDDDEDIMIINRKPILSHKSTTSKAQKCIKLENLLLEELPICNQHLEEFIAAISLSFMKIVTEEWYRGASILARG